MGTFNAGSIEASLTLDRSKFVRELQNARAQAKRFEQNGIELEVKVKDADLTQLEARIKAITNNLSVDLNTAQAMVNAQVLKDLLDSMTPHVIKVSIASSAAKVSLTALERRLKALDTTAHVNVDVDNASMAKARSEIRGMGGDMQQWQAILLAILAFLPMIAGALGIAGGAIIAFTATLVSAGLGAGVLAVGLTNVWKNALKVKDATGQIKEFQDAWKDTKKVFADAMTAIQPTALKVLIQALNLARNLIPRFVPIFNAFGKVALTALTGLSNWFNGPEGKGFLKWIEKFGAAQFGHLLSILGKLGQVVINVLEAFSPLAEVMMNGLEKVTSKWVEWSGYFEQTSGFTSFIQYIITNGPKMLDMFGSLIDALINIAVAVAPLAGPMFDAFTKIFDFIANMDPSVLGLIVTTVTALWLAFQGVSAAMGVIGAIMAGGWVALIVVAVVAVAAVVLYLWHTSESFRDAAMNVWNAIASFVGTALAAIKAYFNDIWPDLKQIITDVWPYIKFTIVASLEAIWAVVKVVWAAILTVIKIVSATIAGIIHVLAAVMRGDWSGALNAMLNMGRSILGALWGFVRSIFSAGAGFIGGVVNALKNLVVTAFGGMRSGGVAAISAFRASIVSQFSNILALVRNAANGIKNVFSGAGSWLIGAGRNIISGLLRGINSMIGAVRSKLSALTNMIPSWKGPESKDRRLLQPSGRWIMESLMKGVDDMTPAVQRKFNSITDLIAGVNPNSGSGASVNAPGTMAPVAGAGGVHVTMYVNNPVAEKSSVTATREMTSLAALGVV